jgi:hypothetical protein
MSDSLESAIPWDKVNDLLKIIRETIMESGRKLQCPAVCSFRVAQVYDAGCCIYTYYTLKSQRENLMKHAAIVHKDLRGAVVRLGGWFLNFII